MSIITPARERSGGIAAEAARVQLKGLHKKFPSGTVPAVDIEELVIGKGEFVTLLGPSGCGKSTTMRMIAGLEQPTRGDILFDDESVVDVPVRRRNVAMVFQNYALYPHMTVRANLEYGLRKHKVAKAERSRRVDRVAAMLDIADLLARKPRELSGGQQQRVALGRAIIREPRLLLLDEPLSNLDAKLRTTMRAELVGLQRETGCTTVFVTHDQLEAMTMSDRIAVLHAGRLQQYDQPEVIYNRPANLFVAGFMGSPAMNFFDGELTTSPVPTFTSAGMTLAVPGRVDPAIFAGGPTVLGIRPEDIALGASTDGSSDSTMDATITLVELVGAEKYVRLNGDAGAFMLRVNATVRVNAGDRVPCRIPLDKLHLFRQDTGERVSLDG